MTISEQDQIKLRDPAAPQHIKRPHSLHRTALRFRRRIRQLTRLKLALLKNVGNHPRRLLLIGIDLVILTVATYIAFILRFDQFFPLSEIAPFIPGASITIIFKIFLFYLFGLYRPLLRHSGLEMLEIILKVTLLTDGIIVIFSSIFAPAILPRTVQIISALIALFLIINSRLTIRSLIWRTNDITLMSRTLQRKLQDWQQLERQQTRVLIYGAGVTGYQVSQSLNLERSYDIVGFIDDNPTLKGRELSRMKIFHSSEMGQLIQECQVNQVLLAIPSAPAKRKARILERLQEFPISIKTVPSAQEIVSGKVSVSQLRDIDIADLLGREEVPPEPHLLKADIAQKTVLVTGAGGSIGSELCRQIAELQPKHLILLDSSEFALYSIDIEIQENFPNLRVSPYLGSVTDADYLRQVFLDEQVETIYHAAAYKHVPLVEGNPAQGILNNTYGTYITAKTAQDCAVSTFVLISTDKAVRPTNVMGATKRAAELVLQGLAAQPETQTRFVMVRFGNVLGSSGSVVPRFRHQIAAGKPITLTHREITRYFMTIPEAARLVIQAGAMGKGGEVFLLDMGEPVKIYDLAVQIIKLSGLQPGRDIDIQITGLRPGEKLYEELLISGENVQKTQHPKIYAAVEHMLPWDALEPMLQQLFTAARQTQVQPMMQILHQLVPEYQPQHSALTLSQTRVR
ncbi:polysaccharide biosynthesis protein [Lyngbya confervoides]|uniref:Polysaccharide biosynthesis protein n=1 Tax=Lyngbya confervoides BDU141951 TaxID=1574623 RepID=A0ABD4T5U4_9CYAN|nr:nucleoside-diphosphate sugar epimerase/dehydratase [Lyngbya confervoides]MCM1984039.1 polysaccharide biosynthesis protein [Lyngbya confervoides BDU141951]